MSQAIEAINKLENYKQVGLDDLLLKLCHLGEPSLCRMRKGWWCRVKMHVTAKGVQFEIESETNCDTPSDAARQCAQRALEALKQWE